MKKAALRLGLAALLAAWLPVSAQAAPPREVRLDYAYYAPTSLVLKQQGLLERALEPQGITVKWVFSQGSNRSLEYLNGGSTDFASTAGLAAVLSRANGAPIRTVYVASRPEWTALVVPKNSPIARLEDLKGKKVAATKGTDPFLFLLQSLQQVGLDKSAVEIVHLQHPDGRVALERGDVAAWAGLDPLMAGSELQAGSRLLYRNIDFNSYGVLSVSETFAERQPELIRQVIAAYEQARQWAIANPDALAELLAEQAKLPLEVARLQLSRTDFSNPQPGAEHVAALKAAAPILLDEQLVRPGTDVARVVDELIAPQLAAQVIGQPATTAGR
ncbi:aliphatic sulfonates ABC transporter substrate-binding protein [Stutzerimonas nosocomialis]|uniref:Putative aliphatic sulfonates-binding protein n=1 Tax=Stutzerimonas nosocomialis TaxID=1056496 RepID=A0A5R9QID4_9GAMM|nr:aliphatic sulfonate ABC transporter substrate-binding protein [Stutzerimonas nosocomialis]TLX65046.1 aliphatic sulfonates ABC transporter substrate-binding protein [Stutzerimonas nosocomialis]